MAALALFGDKVRARQLAMSTGVPVVPGSQTAMRDGNEAAAFVASGTDGVCYPIMLKASGGGGGRGMRVVNTADEMVSSFDACSREAEAAFGDPTIFVEMLIERARHVTMK